jgi:hypothetical protein
MSKIKPHKIFVSPDDTAVITCCNCHLQKIIPVSSYKGKKSQVKIKCGCKNVFTVELEFRKKFRKKTNLLCKYTKHSLKNQHGNINVTDLTLDGLGFTTFDLDKFMSGDEIEVSFKLDNLDRTAINKEVIVRNVRKDSISAVFS